MPSCEAAHSVRVMDSIDAVIVADLKAKAAKTTSAGVEKLQNVKDRNTRFVIVETSSIHGG